MCSVYKWISYWNHSRKVSLANQQKVLNTNCLMSKPKTFLRSRFLSIFDEAVYFYTKAAYLVGDHVVCRMESDSNWHRGKIIEIDRTNGSSPDAFKYFITFNFHREDKNHWANANELVDDAICGDPKTMTIGYGIIFSDRRSHYGFGKMKAPQIRRLIIMRQCTICQKFFRFIDVHEKREHGFGQTKRGRNVTFNDVLQIKTISDENDEV